MIRMRRSAPWLLGGMLVALGLGITLTAAAAPTGTLSWDSVLPKVGPVLAVLGAIVAVYKGIRAAVRDVALGVVAAHDADKLAHQPAAHESHRPIEESVHEINLALRDILGRLNLLAETARIDSRRLEDVDERLTKIEMEVALMQGVRNPMDSPHRKRSGDPAGYDGRPERGR